MNYFEIILLQPLANGLIIFYRVLGNNLGLAIIGFSLFLRFLLNPLTKPYMESMKKMRDVAPQLEKLKKKYKDDKMAFAKAQADFYREKKINPGAGCLPYLLQIVVLIAFFNVFSKTISLGGDLTSHFNALLYNSLKFANDQVINTKFLYLDLTKPDVLSNLGLPFNIPGPLLILSAVLQLISSKIMIPLEQAESDVAKKTSEKSDDMQVSMQKSMSYTFPLFTLFIGMRFASALALYWTVFSLTQVYQQVTTQGWGSLTPLVNKIIKKT
jgi:YidC/Oxa1 family membrane protein insertase